MNNFDVDLSSFALRQPLESKGLDLIANDSLLNSILDIYNLDYPRITVVFDNYLKNIYDYGRPLVHRNFFSGPYGEAYDGYIPIDYPSLSNDVEFLNTLKVLRWNSKQIAGYLHESKTHVENVIKLIEEELN